MRTFDRILGHVPGSPSDKYKYQLKFAGKAVLLPRFPRFSHAHQQEKTNTQNNVPNISRNAVKSVFGLCYLFQPNWQNPIQHNFGRCDAVLGLSY